MTHRICKIDFCDKVTDSDVGSPLPMFFGRLGVVLERGFDTFMTHALLNNFGIDSGCYEHCCVGASQVVECESGESGFFDDRLQDPHGDVPVVKGLAVRRLEEHGLGVVRIKKAGDLFFEHLQVVLGEVDFPDSLGCLAGTNGERSGSEVDVSNVEVEEFTDSKSCCQERVEHRPVVIWDCLQEHLALLHIKNHRIAT